MLAKHDTMLPMAPRSGRVAFLETARGLACLLLVAYHVIGDSPDRGLRLPVDHWLPIASNLFAHIRMPLFSFISGMVLATAIASSAEWAGKTRSKARRLLIPMAGVGLLHYVNQIAFVEPPAMAIWQILYLPYEHFWFLQATFLLMLVTFTGSLLVPGRDFARFAPAAAVVGAMVLFLVEPWQPDVFSTHRAFYLAPYFFSGMAVRYHLPHPSAPFLSGGAARAALIGIVAGLFAINAWGVMSGTQVWGSNLLGLALGVAACLLIVSVKVAWQPLAWIGLRSYPIYLFHVIFTAGARIFLDRVPPDFPPVLMFLVGLAAGLIGPILLSEILVRNRLSALIFLGIAKRKPPQSAAREEGKPRDQFA